MSKTGRIALSGGPGGGKSTAADLFRREIGERVVIVPETATLLFSGGFPRAPGAAAAQHTQRAIYETQRAIEDVQSACYAERVLLCDRGTVDGCAYWPADSEVGFFESMGTTLEAELARYDAVIFFETAAAGDIRIEGGNTVRTESNREAVELDQKLRDLWSQHPRFTFVAHSDSFFDKLRRGLERLESVMASNHRME